MLQRHRHQIVLAGKVLIERTLRDARTRGNIIHRNPQKALAPEQSERGVENA